MNDSLYIAATGLHAQQLGLDTIANNLANISTAGFKKSRVNFQEMMHVEAAHDTPRPMSGASPLGISVSSVAKDFSAASITQTNSPMDVAINGNGFFEVIQADGSRGYVRGGTLHVTKDAYLATSGGLVLKPAIHIPANVTSIAFSADGKVSVQTSPQAQPIEVAQLELASFSNPSGLKIVGSGVYAPTDASGEAVYARPGSQGLGKIAQGMLEGSNVAIVDEMVTLMVTQRAYELSSKAIQASDEIMAMTNNLRR